MLNPRPAVDSPLTSNAVMHAVAPDTQKGGTDLSVARDSLACANDSCYVLGTEVFTNARRCQKVSLLLASNACQHSIAVLQTGTGGRR